MSTAWIRPEHSASLAVRRVVLGILFVCTVGPGARAQELESGSAPDSAFCESDPTSRTADVRGLAAVYCTRSSVLETSFHVAHVTAGPVFYGVVPSVWVGAGLARSRTVASAAYRVTLAQAVTYGVTIGVKYGVSRPRPYVNRSLVARVVRHQGDVGRDARLSFPSGHASISTALVTSWSLSYPRWYVIAPGALWATGVTLSRVHLGVHYPSDVIAGAALGAGVAILVHQLRDVVTPGFLEERSGQEVAPAIPISIQIQF